MDDLELLTLAETAKILRRSVSCLQSWRLNGQHPELFRKVAGRILVHRDDLKKFIASGANK